eukprot:s1802_g20.t1
MTMQSEEHRQPGWRKGLRPSIQTLDYTCSQYDYTTLRLSQERSCLTARRRGGNTGLQLKLLVKAKEEEETQEKEAKEKAEAAAGQEEENRNRG